MTTHVAFLRGVNVGGKNRLLMDELCRALAEGGLADATTVLQSGNVLFASDETEAELVARIGAVIDKSCGLEIEVIIRSGTELALVVARNPLVSSAAIEPDPATLHVAFLAEHPTDAAIATLDPDRSPPDAFVVTGREVYLSYPGGSGRSRLTLGYLERQLGTVGTARNWRTVQRLTSHPET